nr:MAG TPA: hypothetical protein [Caudoviricetes sp.]
MNQDWIVGREWRRRQGQSLPVHPEGVQLLPLMLRLKVNTRKTERSDNQLARGASPA